MVWYGRVWYDLAWYGMVLPTSCRPQFSLMTGHNQLLPPLCSLLFCSFRISSLVLCSLRLCYPVLCSHLLYSLSVSFSSVLSLCILFFSRLLSYSSVIFLYPILLQAPYECNGRDKNNSSVLLCSSIFFSYISFFEYSLNATQSTSMIC